MKLHQFSTIASLLLVAGVSSQSSLPQVDLGYEIHQAISLNETGQTYNFSNIRYAQPPVGNLRFAAPVPPTGRNPVVQNGSQGVICPQATPAWEAITEEYALYILNGTYNSFNYTSALLQLEAELEAAEASPPAVDPRTTEDCLFLDVIVPKAVFDNANNKHRRRSGAGAPVLLWIYGGGYTLGSKDGSGNPSGLIEASQAAGGQGIVFVEINYRLGALGWLAGPTLQESGGVSNAALYDQRLAIEWVKQNIHLFGGDPNQITLLGESAGGGSIMHQVTAFGGQQGVSFQKAIMQSPGFLNTPSNFVQENVTQTFLAILNVSSIEEARNASSEAVIAANTYQVALSQYGSFTYGPVVDGVFVPALPGLLLGAGQFAKNISVMVGHNANEGPLFAPPYVNTEALFAEYIQVVEPTIQPEVLSYITDVLYPANYSGAYGYIDVQTKLWTFIAESTFVCNTYYLDTAFNGTTYAYEFEVPPAFHGFDVQYTFYDGQGTNLSNNLIAPIAEALQGIITNFAQTGNPNGPGIPNFPMWGSNATLMGLNATGLTLQKDPSDNPRCAWWQKALYY